MVQFVPKAPETPVARRVTAFGALREHLQSALEQVAGTMSQFGGKAGAARQRVVDEDLDIRAIGSALSQGWFGIPLEFLRLQSQACGTQPATASQTVRNATFVWVLPGRKRNGGESERENKDTSVTKSVPSTILLAVMSGHGSVSF